MRRFSLPSIVVAGCAAAPPPARPPAPAPALVVADAPSEPEPPATVSAPPEIAEIADPDPAACRLSADEWSFSELRLSAGGARFASVIGAAVTLVVPVANEPSALVASFDGAVAIRLLARASDVSFYTEAPRALLGIVTPEADTALHLGSASAGTLELGLNASPVLASPSPVRDELGCSDALIVPAEFDARASVTKRKNLPKRWVAREGVPIAAVKGGPGVGSLVEGVEVGVLEARGADSRVLAEGPGFVVAGWVASTELTTSPSLGVGFGTGTGRFAERAAARLKLPSCAHDLTLVGELGDERAIIGQLRAGAHYRVLGEPSDELVQVGLPYATWLYLEKGARLSVKRSELLSCSPD